MTKTIFLTGAAGFIGYHLALHLAQRGDRVIGFDNFNSYYSSDLKRDRAKNLKNKGVEVVEGDLGDQAALAKTIKENAVTHIVNLAAQAGVRYSLDNPHAYIQSNITGFVNLLEICRELKGVPFIYASSSSVYGNTAEAPFTEGAKTDNPASLYGATKKADELIAASYHNLFNIPVTGLRFFTVYGPWGRPDMAYYLFTKAILAEEPIHVFNGGDLARDFTYIDDIVKGTAAAIDLEAPCEIFNLGNSKSVTLDHFINVLENALNKKAIRENYPMQAGDVKSTFADIEKSQRLLGFQPTTSLEEGIPNFVDWYLRYHKEKIAAGH